MTTAITNDQSEELLILAVYAGMLRHACQSALDLLQDPNADHFDAHKIERLLIKALESE